MFACCRFCYFGNSFSCLARCWAYRESSLPLAFRVSITYTSRSDTETVRGESEIAVNLLLTSHFRAPTFNGSNVVYYELGINKFQQQIYPNLGPANLVGYNGSSPGPTFWIEKGTQTVLRVTNHGDLSASTHLHGSWSTLLFQHLSFVQS